MIRSVIGVPLKGKGAVLASGRVGFSAPPCHVSEHTEAAMARSPGEDDIRCIYRETIDALYAFVSRRCAGDRALAEDVAQEAWLRAIPAWRRDGLPDRPLAWFTTVAARLLSNHFRRAAMRPFDEQTDSATAADHERAAEHTER